MPLRSNREGGSDSGGSSSHQTVTIIIGLLGVVATVASIFAPQVRDYLGFENDGESETRPTVSLPDDSASISKNDSLSSPPEKITGPFTQDSPVIAGGERPTRTGGPSAVDPQRDDGMKNGGSQPEEDTRLLGNPGYSGSAGVGESPSEETTPSEPPSPQIEDVQRALQSDDCKRAAQMATKYLQYHPTSVQGLGTRALSRACLARFDAAQEDLDEAERVADTKTDHKLLQIFRTHVRKLKEGTPLPYDDVENDLAPPN